MKYQCEICGSEYLIANDKAIGICAAYDEHGKTCDGDLIEIPDYETPDQYKKRTGKVWQGYIWYRVNRGGRWNLWAVTKYIDDDIYDDCQVVLCTSKPPPPDWEPIEN